MSEEIQNAAVAVPQAVVGGIFRQFLPSSIIFSIDFEQ